MESHACMGGRTEKRNDNRRMTARGQDRGLDERPARVLKKSPIMYSWISYIKTLHFIIHYLCRDADFVIRSIGLGRPDGARTRLDRA